MTDSIVSLSAERIDGAIQNAVTGMGDPLYDKTTHTTVGYSSRLQKMQIESLYESNWICGNCIDAFPVEATRKWLEVKLGGGASDKRIIKDFIKYQERLGVRKKFEQAGKWARLYGGAAIVIIAEDGQPLDRPMKTDRIKTIRSLEVLDRHKIRPYLVNADPLNPEFYELILPPYMVAEFQVAIDQVARPGAGLRIHHTRVIRFDGIEMPPDVMLRHEGWGGDILNRLFDTFNRFEMTNTAIANLVDEASLFIYSIQGLADLLSKSDEKSLATLRRRLTSMRINKGSMKALILDAKEESASVITRSFAGLPELMDRMQGHMVGATGVPATVLFGSGPVGLAAQGTGQSEENVWQKKVNQYQEEVFTPRLRSPEDEAGLFDLIWLAQDGPTKGKTPDDWGFEFRPLEEPTLEEQVALRERQSNIDRTYTDMQVLLKEEIRSSRFDGSDYTIETTLDKELWDKQQEEANASFDDYGNFGDDGTQDAGQAQLGGDQAALPAGADGAAATQPALAAAKTDSACRFDAGIPARVDAAEPIKYVLDWQGLKLGVTHEPGDLRHGKPMAAAYSHVRGSYGDAEDGMAIDAYLGPNPESTAVFKVRQIKPDGTFDESKWMFGCDTLDEARDLYLRHIPAKLFGGIDPAKLSELSQYRADCGDECECKPCQLAVEAPAAKKKRKKKLEDSQIGRWWDYLEPGFDREVVGSGSRADAIDAWAGYRYSFATLARSDAKPQRKSPHDRGLVEKEIVEVDRPTVNHSDANDDPDRVAEQHRDLADHITDRALTDSNAIVGSWLEQMRGWLSDKQSSGAELADVQAQLPELYNQLDGDEFARNLAQWSIVSDLSGRDEVMQEVGDDRTDSERLDDRRIWVNDRSVANNGYYRRIKDGKTKPEVSPFVSSQEFQQLQVVNDVRHRPGINNSFFVETPSGDRMVFKSTPQKNVVDAASEVLSAEIAQTAKIKANNVRLVSVVAHTPFKPAGTTGTLHDLVPGKSLMYLDRPRWDNTEIQVSSWRSTANNAALRGAVQHPDLAKLVGLDLFIGNPDRHTGNIFYDPRKGFHGIDMGNGFDESIAKQFADDMENMPDQALAMIADEPSARKNLGHLVRTLETMPKQNSPESIKSRLLLYTAAASGHGQFRAEFEQHLPAIERLQGALSEDRKQYDRELAQYKNQISPEQQSRFDVHRKLAMETFPIIDETHEHIPRIIQRLKPYTQS